VRSETVTIRNELFVATATLASHASAQGKGFRQRDVRFFAELFSNWAHPNQSAELSIQNVQIQRYLSFLAKEGFLKSVSRSTRPLYKLTRIGLLDLLTRLVESKRDQEPSQFLFLLFFLRGYREWLLQLVRLEGEQFPPSMRIELESLLDTSTLIQRELKSVDQQLAKLDTRIQDAKRTSTLVAERLKGGTTFDDVVFEVEKRIPYELNSRRPLSELIASIQPDQRRWELLEGNKLRASVIWEPTRRLLKEYRIQLASLQ
jgi:hypothetical protein